MIRIRLVHEGGNAAQAVIYIDGKPVSGATHLRFAYNASEPIPRLQITRVMADPASPVTESYDISEIEFLAYAELLT